MCSILGIIDFDCKDQLKSKKINKINNLLTHRGPDDEGYYNDQFISLAFNRLSILDLVNGNQPIVKDHIVTTPKKSYHIFIRYLHVSVIIIIYGLQ